MFNTEKKISRRDKLGLPNDNPNTYLLSDFFNDIGNSNIWNNQLRPLLYRIKSGEEKETDWEAAQWKTKACFRKDFVFLFDATINPNSLSFSKKTNKPNTIYANNITPLSADLLEFIQENYQQYIKIPIDDFINIGNNRFKQTEQTTAKSNTVKKNGLNQVFIKLFKTIAVLMRLNRN